MAICGLPLSCKMRTPAASMRPSLMNMWVQNILQKQLVVLACYSPWGYDSINVISNDYHQFHFQLLAAAFFQAWTH